MQKFPHLLGGIIIGWATLWAINLLVSYSFYLSGVSFPVLSPAGILIGLIEMLIAVLPYWFLRNRKPDLAKGILIGIGLTALITLLLSLLAF